MIHRDSHLGVYWATYLYGTFSKMAYKKNEPNCLIYKNEEWNEGAFGNASSFFIWKKKSHGPQLPARYPSDAAKYPRLMGKIFFPLEMAKKNTARDDHQLKAEPKGKQSSNHPFSTSYVGFGGESQPRCEFFGTVELVRLPTMKVHHPRDNAAGEGSSSFSGELGWEKRAIDDRNSKTSLGSLLWIQNQIEGHFGSLRVLLLGF